MFRVTLIEIGDEVGVLFPGEFMAKWNLRDGDIIEAHIEPGSVLLKLPAEKTGNTDGKAE